MEIIAEKNNNVVLIPLVKALELTLVSITILPRAKINFNIIHLFYPACGSSLYNTQYISWNVLST